MREIGNKREQGNEINSKPESQVNWHSIYGGYLEGKNWLESLITDPTAERYQATKTSDEYRKQQELSFERTRLFMDFLGRPQDFFSSFHVAGTGGKGSVTTMIDAILKSAGEKTGRHISPYVQLPNEKLIVDGRMIKPSEFTRLVNELKQEYEAFVKNNPNHKPLHGEAWIALTYEYFKKRGVRWTVIETGMGGRLDPTNTLNSEVAVITNVDYDHIPQLGETIEEIAWHKAGIIKPGKPVITAETKDNVLEIIKKEAQDNNSPLFIYGIDFFIRNVSHKDNGMEFDIETPFGSYNNIYINMFGEFQAMNAATAIMAVLAVSKEKEINITEASVKDALSKLVFPGRMEKVQDNPLVIIDGAHNPQKMRAAAKALKGNFPKINITLLIGMLKTKDAVETLRQILPMVNNVVTTTPRVIGKPSFFAKEMAEMVRDLNPNIQVSAENEIINAVEEAKKIQSKNGLLFISGSIYMLGDVRNLWYPAEEILKGLEYNQS